MSDLYANNFTLVYDDLLKDFKASNKEKIKSDKGEVVKQKFNTITNSDGYDDFGDTKYVNPSCMLEFYKKYSSFDALYRKYLNIKKTPSWSFIQSSTKEKIIPNPLGLLRRKGNEKQLLISYQKVGDKYMTTLSNSLKYSRHLTDLGLSGNRLSSFGT